MHPLAPIAAGATRQPISFNAHAEALA